MRNKVIPPPPGKITLVPKAVVATRHDQHIKVLVRRDQCIDELDADAIEKTRRREIVCG
jgi:hypothetical protein